MTTQARPTDVYLDEYTREDVIAKYINETAGAGIAYVLNHVYGPIYLQAIKDLKAIRPPRHRFRVLEYGCGGGMTLMKLVELLKAEDAELERGYGTDFSPPMIEAARNAAARHLPAELNRKLTYAVAPNEALVEGLSQSLRGQTEPLLGAFDLIVGVNTTRYCHRLRKENEFGRDLFRLLAPGGYSIMIDVNWRSPFFRTKFIEMFTRPAIERYVPSLKEYARPLREAGFVIKETRNFCWIPHSASPGLLAFCRRLAPVLDACCPWLAMRALVIAQKPR